MAFEAPFALLAALPLLYLWWRIGRGPREAWPLRIAIILLSSFVLGSPVLRRGMAQRRIVFLIDRSLSAGDEALKAGSEMLALAMARKSRDDRISAVVFGDGASVVGADADLGSELRLSSLDNSSDLNEGMSLAASLCGGPGGRIFLISDGLHTGTDPMELLPELHKNSVSLDYWPIEKDEKKDVAITRVGLPERVHAGHPFELLLEMYSPEACKARVEIERERGKARQDIELRPGRNRFVFRDVAGSAGLSKRLISVFVQEDTKPENNTSLAVTEVVGLPAVLVINGNARPDNFTLALSASGFPVRIAGPDFHVSSATLKAFDAVILENVALSSMNDLADAALQNYVAEMGGGLLLTGGKRSFASGGYYQSRLEEVLPVSMERKEAYKRPRLAMCVVLDRSGSMTAPVGGNLAKMDLANRAAAEALSLLFPEDDVAVFAVDSEAHRVVPLTQLGRNYADIQGQILSIESMGGGIFVYTGLQAAVSELIGSKAPTRHIVLFADAADSEEPGEYKALVEKWRAAGGTISVIGLGTEQDPDAAFLKDIASRAGGVALFTSDPHSLPRVFCEDAMRIARKTFIEQKTEAAITPSVVQLGKLDITRFPSFLGYNLCYARPEASQAVVTQDEYGAPVLAFWQHGLGRAAALTCEADGEYSGELSGWRDYKPFFPSLVEWLRREREDLSLFGSVKREGNKASVIFEMDSRASRETTGATAFIIPPDESRPLRLPLEWDSPQTMSASFSLRQNGVYHGIILTREGKRVSLPPVALPYSPEFEPRDAQEGLRLMKALADSTGGDRVMHVQELFSRAFRTAGRAGRPERSIARYLSLAVILLLLTEIATRKALWRHIIPVAVREQAGVAVSNFRKLPARLRPRRFRERLAIPPLPAQAPQSPPVTPLEAEKQKEKAESIFAKAKRRSRR